MYLSCICLSVYHLSIIYLSVYHLPTYYLSIVPICMHIYTYIYVYNNNQRKRGCQHESVWRLGKDWREGAWGCGWREEMEGESDVILFQLKYVF